MIETEQELSNRLRYGSLDRARPPRWKKHHRWQWGWQKWQAFIKLIERRWPRND